MNRTAGDLAKYLGARLEGDAAAPLRGVASPERAGAEDLIYLASSRHAERAQDRRRGALWFRKECGSQAKR